MQSEFDIVRKGYNQKQVDDYIKHLETIIETYVKNESQVKNTLQQAEQKAELIVREAETEANELINNAYSKLHSIQDTIKTQRTLLDSFRKDYNRFILKYVNEINKRDFVYLQNTVDDIDKYISDAFRNAEETKNGYFIPNSNTNSPILIVEPCNEDNSISDSFIESNFSEDYNIKNDRVNENSVETNNNIISIDILNLTSEETLSKQYNDNEKTIELLELHGLLTQIETYGDIESETI